MPYYTFDIMAKQDIWLTLSPEKKQRIIERYNKINTDVFDSRHASQINPKEVYTFNDFKRNYYFHQLDTEHWLRQNNALPAIDN